MKKRYWIIPLLAFLVGLDWYIRAPDSAARNLTSAIVKAQPGIKEVRWELDRDWLRAHFIEVPEK